MSTNIKPNQFAAIAYIAVGMPLSEVAQKLSIAPETISRWRRQPEFVAALNIALSDLHHSAQGELRSLLGLAVAVYKTALTDSTVPMRTRLAAAEQVLALSSIMKDPLEAVGPEDAATVKKYDQYKEGGVEARLCLDLKRLHK